MIELPSETDIRCPADQLFDIIVDVRHQDRWLAPSSAFRGTVDITENPVRLGTTYREPGPLGVRNGTVTEYERPAKITFHQPMTMRFHFGTIDIVMCYTLTPGTESTHVRRCVTVRIPWPLKLVQPIVVHGFRTESARTLMALKAYADDLS